MRGNPRYSLAVRYGSCRRRELCLTALVRRGEVAFRGDSSDVDAPIARALAEPSPTPVRDAAWPSALAAHRAGA